MDSKQVREVLEAAKKSFEKVEADLGWTDDTQAAIQQLESALASLQPAQEPVADEVTPEMIAAAEAVDDLYRMGQPQLWARVYRAMRAASPLPQSALSSREQIRNEALEEAPANSLPTWQECALRVDNSDFIAKRVAEGGYGAEHDTLLANELHRFIYEYDDKDPYRSAWFMHRLELVLKECAEAAIRSLQSKDGKDGAGDAGAVISLAAYDRLQSLCDSQAARIIALEESQSEPSSSDAEDARRWNFMFAEGCQIESLELHSGERFRVRWPDLDEEQAEWFATPREAIDAAIAAIEGKEKP